jgi:cytochrome b subunit of formate dehydrogenase
MANTLIPVEERRLTPEEVEALDRRRRRGHLFLVIGLQTLLISGLLLLFSGQDFTYSPNGIHPMVWWNLSTFTLSMVCLAIGVSLKRGSNEFLSY